MARRKGRHKARHGKRRSRRSNPVLHHRRRRGSRRTHSRRRGRRSVRRNPGLSLRSLVPSVSSVKDVLRVGGGVAVGYLAVNGVMLGLNQLFLDKFKADKSPALQAAIDIAARAFVGVPVARMVGGSVMPSQRGNITAGALGNVAIKGLRQITAVVPGLPPFAQDMLGDYDGGVYDYLTAANQPPGMHDYLQPGGHGIPNTLAPTLAGARRGSW